MESTQIRASACVFVKLVMTLLSPRLLHLNYQTVKRNEKIVNASKQEVEELKDALTEAAQEVVNLLDALESVHREFDTLCSEGSRTGVSRISDASGKRLTLMRSNGDWTMTGVLQTLKETPKTITTYNQALHHLLNALRDVEKIVAKMSKFKLTSGENPEHTMEYILDVLGQKQPQRVALMDVIRSGKHDGDDSLKVTKTYFGIRNRARNAVTTQPTIDNIISAAGDDGIILLKIVEETFVPILPALTKALAGDAHQIGIRELVGNAELGLSVVATATRLVPKANPMEMVNSIFAMVLEGTEWFVNKEARCLDPFEEDL